MNAKKAKELSLSNSTKELIEVVRQIKCACKNGDHRMYLYYKIDQETKKFLEILGYGVIFHTEKDKVLTLITWG